MNCTNIPLETCDINKHFSIDSLKPYFALQDLPAFYCINKDYMESNPPMIQGYNDGDNYYWV